MSNKTLVFYYASVNRYSLNEVPIKIIKLIHGFFITFDGYYRITQINFPSNL